MKKLSLLLLLPVLAVSCNRTQPTVTNPPAATGQNTNLSQAALQTYSSADGFSFQYPKDWQVTGMNLVAKNPTGCGDAWGDAVYCFDVQPTTMAQQNVSGPIIVLFFKTQLDPLKWCQSHGYIMSDCQPQDMHGYAGAQASDQSVQPGPIYFDIAAHKGALVTFMSVDPAYVSQLHTMADSITFSN